MVSNFINVNKNSLLTFIGIMKNYPINRSKDLSVLSMNDKHVEKL